MFDFSDITFGLFGRAALTSHYSFTQPVDETPVFSSQPQSQVLYQEGGAMRILGANAAPVTGWQWQKQNTDGSWSDIAGRTGQTFNMSSASLAEGVYRVRAINGNASAVSNPVQVVSVYLFIQNDIANQPQPVKTANNTYTFSGGAGTRYISALYRRFSDDSAFIPAGVSTSRAVAAWSSTNSAAFPVSNVQANGQLISATKAGSSVVTASVGALSSSMTATIG